MAAAARVQRRHWGLALSFAALVLVPLALVIFYLWGLAVERYDSSAGFTVRQEHNTSSADILGGLAQFSGGGIASDGDILYAFIQSQEMVAAVDAQADLRAHYTQHWPRDFVFALWPDATLEDLLWYWRRVVRLSYDSASGLTEVQVLAYDPDIAQKIARAVVAESEARINALSEQAREDAMRYARGDVAEALERLGAAREALTGFRTRTRIVDPAVDIQSRMGVMNNLQQQLAEALIASDMLRGTTRDNDPRLINARQRIDVIRERIAIERQTFASDNTDTGAVGEDYPNLIAEYETLNVNREFAEQTYRAALTALEAAREDAARNSRYLAVYIKPTLAESAQYPRRWILTGLAGLFLVLVWSIGALIYYSIRDRG
ncbi:sugar transporter [Pontibaca sp. S1109L]|uniref:Sugar transporter n=1 Tax=Pontibaca salina TaxID=2795731 RepID=A0A934HTP4_9RHOB|nr:sugar transporter [Pontibaca salina]